MTGRWLTVAGVWLVAATLFLAVALDPPHDSSQSIECSSCHTPHDSPGVTLTSVAGNGNLCLSCHVIGGLGSNFPFVELDQALPGPGLPAGQSPSGTFHRWDSGPSGHAIANPTNTSTGTLATGGAFTGVYAKTYTVTITASGDSGAAQFSWTDTLGSGGSVTSGVDVALDQGVTLTFTDGGGSPAFDAGDVWLVYVRTDLEQPTIPELTLATESGKATCSTCHNQHSQEQTPFDASVPAYGGAGTGEGRHYQRVANDTNQMCNDCHAPRNVTTSSLGSHPVGVSIPGGDYTSPASLPLEAGTGQVECLTCHDVHYTPTADGTLLRMAGNNAMCAECHTLADTITPASHLDSGSGVLWPGGQYGSTFPAVAAAKRGFCTNCHQTHGWPDSGDLAQDYPTLLVETPTNVCVTCHDGSPASDELADFSSTLWVNAGAGAIDNLNLNTRHDVRSVDQAISGTDLACSDCHDPHTSTPAAKVRPDPDPGDGRVPAAGLSWTGSDLRSEWCLDCHDGSYPAGVTPPTTAITDILDSHTNNDDHGTSNGGARLKPGYGWADDDILPCTACHVEGHGSTNLFQLRTTIFSKDGSTPIPSDCGGTTVAVTDINVVNTAINGWCFCNTCHDDSMGSNRDNCFESGCHAHDDRM